MSENVECPLCRLRSGAREFMKAQNAEEACLVREGAPGADGAADAPWMRLLAAGTFFIARGLYQAKSFVHSPCPFAAARPAEQDAEQALMKPNCEAFDEVTVSAPPMPPARRDHHGWQRPLGAGTRTVAAHRPPHGRHCGAADGPRGGAAGDRATDAVHFLDGELAQAGGGSAVPLAADPPVPPRRV